MGSKITVDIDGLKIGGSNPVRVESMLKTRLTDIEGCLRETEALRRRGCELARVAFPEMSLEPALKSLVSRSNLRLMADIHFNHKLALAALDAGCRAIRINPGNMSVASGTAEVVRAAKGCGAVIRIGANSGSLNNEQMAETGGDRGAALALAVGEQLKILLDNGFDRDVILSAKSTSVSETVRVNYMLSQRYQFPLHIGITEAGSGTSGIVKGAVGIGLMLSQGIGDTLRVSLTSPGTEEVDTGYHILRALGIRERGYSMISCPTCGRRRVDVAELSEEVRSMLPDDLPDGFTVAVMGCEVNGPREAAGADLGIAGTPDGFVMFSKGKIVCSAPMSELSTELKKVVKNIV